MKKNVKHGAEVIAGESVILDAILGKLDAILQRLSVIEADLRELKETAYLKGEQKEETVPEFFMEK